MSGRQHIEALLDIGRPADAKRLVEEALAADPEDTSLRILLLRCLIAMDDMETALSLVDTLGAENPDWDWLYRMRAVVLIGLDKPIAATKAARRAVALDPEDAWNHYQLAVALNSAASRQSPGSEAGEKKKDAARKAAEHAVALEPQEPALHRLIGYLHSEPEHREIRERAWRKALELDPEDTAAMTELAGDEAVRSLRSSGLDKLGQALRIDPQGAPHARQIVADAFKRALMVPLLLTVPSEIATIVLALGWVPETWWSRAVPIGFAAASLMLLAEALLRVRSSLRAMVMGTLKLTGWLVAWVVVAGLLPILWLVTRHLIVMVCLVLVLIPGACLAAVLSWTWVKWVFTLGWRTASSEPAPAWDVYLDNQLGSAGGATSQTRNQKSQNRNQKSGRKKSGNWLVYATVVFVLSRVVSCIAHSGDDPSPRPHSSYDAAHFSARDFRVGECVKTVGGYLWSPITVTDCADPRAIFRVASLSARVCPNADYHPYQPVAVEVSTICLAKNLGQGLCYSWPGYRSDPTAQVAAKTASCTDPRVHLKVEKRVDGEASPLVCAPGQSAETFPIPAPGVAYCLSDPNP
ncbi:hypothetical protein AWB85_05215 [Mycobacteroides immunogenum]|uniref:Uncharacterized protein n=1 Tax=Mycobacteroides immunogenum TaxID=83262 RepID=A0A179VFL8_9MYCO|nr:tetratricopeptide repeat protein [Mycobacteroides immunogenum]OAT70708.1 hypothetical protein AWB85_05215 [Mycobacteroides immunogenum]